MLRIMTTVKVSAKKKKSDIVLFKPFVHYGTIITKGKLLIKISTLNLCKADWHPFINGHNLIINIHKSMSCLCV